MYRALMTADVHISNALPFAQRKEGLYTDRLDDTTAVISAMTQYGAENGIKDIWVLGDLIDKRLVDGATLKSTVETLTNAADSGDFEIRLIPGNHEAHDAAGTIFTLEGLANIRKNISVLGPNAGKGSVISVKDGPNFCAMSYRPDEQARIQVKYHRDNHAPQGAVMLLHQSLVGGRAGSWVCPDGVTLEDLDGFIATFAGHFHTPQSITDTVHYLGAPIQHNFGDSGENRGFWEIRINGKSVKMIHVPLRAPQFFSMDWNVHRSGDLLESAKILALQENDYLEIQMEGTTAELKEAAKELAEAKEKIKEAIGLRMVKVHTTVKSEKKTRAKAASTGKKLTWREAVGGYLDVCDTTGLVRARLEELAKQAIEEAERK